MKVHQDYTPVSLQSCGGRTVIASPLSLQDRSSFRQNLIFDIIRIMKSRTMK